MYNKILLVGKPFKAEFYAPKNNETSQGFCIFVIACSHKETAGWAKDYIRCKAWGQFCLDALHKALENKTSVVVEGSIISERYKSKIENKPSIAWTVNVHCIKPAEYAPDPEKDLKRELEATDDDMPF